MTGFIAEHNLPINIIEHQKSPNSKIAKGLTCRTKTSAIVKNVLGHSSDILANLQGLKKNKFSTLNGQE